MNHSYFILITILNHFKSIINSFDYLRVHCQIYVSSLFCDVFRNIFQIIVRAVTTPLILSSLFENDYRLYDQCLYHTIYSCTGKLIHPLISLHFTQMSPLICHSLHQALISSFSHTLARFHIVTLNKSIQENVYVRTCTYERQNKRCILFLSLHHPS